MTIATLLEDFASVSADVPMDPQRPEDLIGYSMGYDAGIAEASARNVEAMRQLTSTLEEMGFGYNEALQQLAASLRPLFTTLVERIVPDCLDASLQLLVIEVIEVAAKRDLESPITVVANPALIPSLEAAARSIASIPLSMKADASMSLTEVRFESSVEETSIDSALLKTELVTALSAFLEPSSEGVVDHG